DDLDMAPYVGRRAVAADHGEALRADAARHKQLVAAGEARGHAHGIPGGTAPAVDGKPDKVHRHQLPELARVLEPRLVPTVVRGPGPPDGREELAATDDLVAAGRDVVLPTARTEKAQMVGARDVAVEQLGQVPPQRRLCADRRLQRERTRQSVRFGDLLEQR